MKGNFRRAREEKEQREAEEQELESQQKLLRELREFHNKTQKVFLWKPKSKLLNLEVKTNNRKKTMKTRTLETTEIWSETPCGRNQN